MIRRDPLRIPRIEGPQKNARLVGLEDGGGALTMNGHGLDRETMSVDYAPTAIGSLKLVTMFCARRISASESRKASVDSAPWFPLTRSTCKPSPAAAALGRVEFQAQIVPAEEPVEGALRLLVPPDVGCGAIGFQAGRDHGLRLDGLLVEIGARAAAPVESIAADRPEVALLGDLQLVQPAQGLQASLEDRLLSGGVSAQNQGVRELGVVVRQLFFKPGPVRLGVPCEAVP